MSKISGRGAGHHNGHPTPRSRSPFDRIPRGQDGRHPVDIAVDSRLGDRVRRKWIVKLQERIMVVLGSHSGLLLKLESMMNEQQRDRERCYFVVGYEHGATEAHASSRCGGAAQPPTRVDLLARALRERILLENIPANEATVALLQCALAFTESQQTA